VEHALTVLAAETKSLAEALGEQPTAPPEWATDVQRMITGNNEAMRAPEPHILSDLQGSMAALRDILARFGQALTAWPELWAHAAERNARQ
jgi:hypothetical protein